MNPVRVNPVRQCQVAGMSKSEETEEKVTNSSWHR